MIDKLIGTHFALILFFLVQFIFIDQLVGEKYKNLSKGFELIFIFFLAILPLHLLWSIWR